MKPNNLKLLKNVLIASALLLFIVSLTMTIMSFRNGHHSIMLPNILTLIGLVIVFITIGMRRKLKQRMKKAD
ncbi:hypothetical protein ACE1TH_11635 [Shouchella sp. JSM 1781072]|uniref:hypothetical protein n=1 Tax=Shouchella sp. JSM 1781072 TaxID=3344581 RepID=UPI0035C13B3E